MTKVIKYMLAQTENDVFSPFSNNKTPIIKLLDNKIIEPKEIEIGNMPFKEWLKKNENELTYFSKPFFSNEKASIKKFYNPEWNLYELVLDKFEDFSIIEKIEKENSQFQSDIRQFNILQKNLERVFDFIEPTELNKQVFGLELRNIILLSSMEVEVHWQNLMKNNGYNKTRLTTKDYVKLCEFINFNFEFKLNNYPDFGIVQPFNDWNTESPTTSLKWYNSYNKVKHDRGNNLHLATLELAITSVSAVLTLLYIRYGQKNIDEKMSSTLFSVFKGVRISKHSLSGYHVFGKDIKYKKYFSEE